MPVEKTRYKLGPFLGWAVAFAFVLAMIVLGLARQRGIEAPQYFTFASSGVMGTDLSVTLGAPNRKTAQKAVDGALGRIAEAERLMTTFREDSEVSAANRNAVGEPVRVSQTTLDCLALALRFCEATAGAFDITIKPLVDLWRASAAKNRMPTDTEVEEALGRVGYSMVKIDADQRTVEFSKGGVSIDLGGVAKGFAVDFAYQAMADAGHPNALMELGGDLYAGGLRDGKAWRVGIQDPRTGKHEGSKVALIIEVSELAVATSGNYRRFSLIEGKRVNHILDPRTGQPAESVPSVTIVAPDCATADALATGVSVLGLERGLELVESMPGVEALLMTVESGDLVFHRSSGFAVYETSPR